MREIYLDHNATTPLAPEVAEAMRACQRESWGNAASQHGTGRRARQRLEEAREGIVALLGADAHSPRADTLLFTSGGTESNNLALSGLCETAAQPVWLIISAIEHPSITGPADALERRGCEVLRAPVSAAGVVDEAWIETQLTAHRDNVHEGLVSVMLGNNETGVLQPVSRLAALCRAQGVRCHTDAVQVAGKFPLSFRDLNVDALTLSAHKFHGPQGIGALLVRHGVQLMPQMHGGFQQAGLRPGTEPVALAIGMFEALRLAYQDLHESMVRVTALRDHLEGLLRAGDVQVVVHGTSADRLPHTSNVSFPGLDRQALQMALDLAGVACSTGSACASGSTDPSPVLIAMGCPEHQLHSSLRFSLGLGTTREEVDEAARRILLVCKDLRSRNPARFLPAVGRNRV